MPDFVLQPNTTTAIAVGAASVQFATTLVSGEYYVITTTTAAWLALGTNPTAVGRTSGNHCIPPNYPYVVQGDAVVQKAALIQDAAGGFASISQLK